MLDAKDVFVGGHGLEPLYYQVQGHTYVYARIRADTQVHPYMCEVNGVGLHGLDVCARIRADT